ncbi:MAG: hypothetical protein FJX62_08810 [Alphaproteobacteria bacterium]|nr:hypothetical protein [Alphaproteobacteria bacterium]
MSEDNNISLAVWDVPMPVVAGERFQIKAGAKAASGGTLAGQRIEAIDARGAVVASGTLGDKPWAGTEALCWTVIDVPAPAAPGLAEYSVRLPSGQDASAARFSVAAAAKPEHTLTVTITERDTAQPLGGVEIRLDAFRGRTDRAGRAEIRICKGDYQLHLWRSAHTAEPRAVVIAGDTSLALTMLHVPEDHPDARWVR